MFRNEEKTNLVEVLKRAYKSFKTNKTFTYAEATKSLDDKRVSVTVSFSGKFLFIRLESSSNDNQGFMFDNFSNKTINLENNTFFINENNSNFTVYNEEEILKVASKFTSLIKASFNPENLIKKAAKKLKVKNPTFEFSDRSASTYCKNDKGEAVLRIADHSANHVLVAKHGHKMPKFNIMFLQDGSKVAFFNEKLFNQNERIAFQPNFI